MIKRLLILILAAGMASTAQATTMNVYLTTDDVCTNVVPGTVITVKLTTDNIVKNFKDGLDFTASGTNTATGGSWQVGNSAVSDDGTESAGDITGAYMLVVMGEEYLAGTVLYKFSATINETGTIGMANVSCLCPCLAITPHYYNLVLHELDVTIPEPMTIVLLGLGGLFLRRRR